MKAGFIMENLCTVVETEQELDERQRTLEKLGEVCRKRDERLVCGDEAFEKSIVSIPDLHIVMIFSNATSENIEKYLENIN